MELELALAIICRFLETKEPLVPKTSIKTYQSEEKYAIDFALIVKDNESSKDELLEYYKQQLNTYNYQGAGQQYFKANVYAVRNLTADLRLLRINIAGGMDI